MNGCLWVKNDRNTWKISSLRSRCAQGLHRYFIHKCYSQRTWFFVHENMLIHMDSAWSLELCSTYQQHFHAQDEIPFINFAGAQKHTKNGSSNQKKSHGTIFLCQNWATDRKCNWLGAMDVSAEHSKNKSTNFDEIRQNPIAIINRIAMCIETNSYTTIAMQWHFQCFMAIFRELHFIFVSSKCGF